MFARSYTLPVLRLCWVCGGRGVRIKIKKGPTREEGRVEGDDDDLANAGGAGEDAERMRDCSA